MAIPVEFATEAEKAKRAHAVSHLISLKGKRQVPADCCFGIRISAGEAEGAVVYFDGKTRRFGIEGEVLEKGEGPSYLSDGQPVCMRVFLDGPLIEVFVNGQTCTTASFAFTHGNLSIRLFAAGQPCLCTRLDMWEMGL